MYGKENENEIINQQFKQDIINAEEEKKKAYPVDIFKDRKVQKEDKKETEEQDQSLIVYKEENKIIKFIKRLFNFFAKK